MTQRQKKALEYFQSGDNCAQSVLKAYCDTAGLTESQAALIAAGFGGGMGRLRQNCGAFSAAVMLCGAMEGENGADASRRAAVYARVQEIHRRFVEELGTISCGELLGRAAESPTPEARTAAYYASRPCAGIVLTACQIIEEQLAHHGAADASTRESVKRMKALILSAHTGGGHDAAAYALRDALGAMGVESRVEDCLAFGGKWLSRAVCTGYVKMVQHAPSMFGKVYRMGVRMSTARFKSPGYYANASYAFRMEKLLEEFQPDMILCTHVFGGQTVTRLKRKGVYHGAFGMVMTDYTLHPFCEDVECDALFVGHEVVRTHCLRRGLKPERVRVTGIPVNPACTPCHDKTEAKRALGLDPDRREVLLVGGSMGAGNLPEAIASLLPALGDSGHLTVVCGSNEKLRAEAAAHYDGDARVTVHGRVSPLYPLMAAADVLVTKSGGLTTTEAMTIGTPMIIINPIEGCETANAQFFEEHGLAEYCRTPEELPAQLSRLLPDEKARERMIAAQHREINGHAAEDIARCVVDIATAKAGAIAPMAVRW